MAKNEPKIKLTDGVYKPAEIQSQMPEGIVSDLYAEADVTKNSTGMLWWKKTETVVKGTGVSKVLLETSAREEQAFTTENPFAGATEDVIDSDEVFTMPSYDNSSEVALEALTVANGRLQAFINDNRSKINPPIDASANRYAKVGKHLKITYEKIATEGLALLEELKDSGADPELIKKVQEIVFDAKRGLDIKTKDIKFPTPTPKEAFKGDKKPYLDFAALPVPTKPEEFAEYMKKASELLKDADKYAFPADVQNAVNTITANLYSLQTTLINNFKSKFGKLDLVNATRDHLEEYFKEVHALLTQFEGVKLNPALVSDIKAFRENFERLNVRLQHKYTTRKYTPIINLSPAEVAAMLNSGAVQFEDVFRLSKRSRGLLAIRSVARAYYGKEFDNMQTTRIEEEMASRKPAVSLVDEMFDSKKTVAGKKNCYVLKPEYSAIAAQLVALGVLKHDAASNTYYSEKKPAITYSQIVDKVREDLTVVSEENITKFGNALNDAASTTAAGLVPFVTDVLDKTGIADKFGSGLQQYNQYANVPVPVLAMHAVMSTGVLNLLDANGKLKDENKTQYGELISYLRSNGQAVLADLVIQVVGYKVNELGEVEQLSATEDVFAAERVANLPKMIKVAQEDAVKNSLMSQENLDRARGVAVIQSTLREKGLWGNPVEIAEQREQYIKANAGRDVNLLLDGGNGTLPEIYTALEANDTAVRATLLKSYLDQRREAVISGFKETYKDESLTLDIKPENYSVGINLFEQDGLFLRNMAVLSRIQEQAFLTVSSNPGNAPQAIADYQAKEKQILTLNNAYLDMAEAYDEAVVLSRIADEVKYAALTRIEDMPVAEGSDLQKANIERNRVADQLRQNKDTLREKTAIFEKSLQNEAASIVSFYADMYTSSITSIYNEQFKMHDKNDWYPYVEPRIKSVIAEFKKLLTQKLPVKPDGTLDIDAFRAKLEEIYEAQYRKEIAALNGKRKERGEDQFTEETISQQISFAKVDINGRLNGIYSKSEADMKTELSTKLGADVVADLETPAKAATAYDTLKEKIKTLPEAEQAQYLIMLDHYNSSLTLQAKNAAMNVVEDSQKLFDEAEAEVSRLIILEVRVPEIGNKIRVLEDLYEKLETCRRKIEHVDFSMLTEDNLKALGFNADDIAAIQEAKLPEQKIKLLERIDEWMQDVSEKVEKLKADAKKEHGIIAVENENGVIEYLDISTRMAREVPVIDLDKAGITETEIINFVSKASVFITTINADEQLLKVANKNSKYIALLQTVEKAKDKLKEMGKDVLAEEISVITRAADPYIKANPMSYADIKDVERAILEIDTVLNDIKSKSPDVQAADAVKEIVAKLTAKKDEFLAQKHALEKTVTTPINPEEVRKQKLKDAVRTYSSVDFANPLNIDTIQIFYRDVEPEIVAIKPDELDALEVEIPGIKALITKREAAKTTMIPALKAKADALVNDDNFAAMKANGTLDAHIVEVEQLISEIKKVETLDASLSSVIRTLTSHKEAAILERDAVAGPRVEPEVTGGVDLAGFVSKYKGSTLETELPLDATIVPSMVTNHLATIEHMKQFVVDYESVIADMDPTLRERLVARNDDLKRLVTAYPAVKERVEKFEVAKTFVDSTNKISLTEKLTQLVESLTNSEPELTEPQRVETANKIIKVLSDLFPTVTFTNADQQSIVAGDFSEKVSQYVDQADAISFDARMKLFDVKDKIPTDGKEKKDFLMDATAYSMSGSRITDEADYSREFGETYIRLESEHVDLPEFKDPRLDADIIPPAKPADEIKYTKNGVEKALKATNKSLKSIKERINESKAALAAYKAVRKQKALARQAYAKILLKKLDLEGELPPMDPTMQAEYAAYCAGKEEPTKPAFDTYAVRQYLKYIAEATYNEETGQLEVTIDGKVQQIEVFVEEVVATCGEPVKRPTASTRSRILHNHLHTIGTRTAMQVGADKIIQLLTDNGFEVTENNINLLFAGRLIKEGESTPISLDSVMDHAANQVTQHNAESGALTIPGRDAGHTA